MMFSARIERFLPMTPPMFSLLLGVRKKLGFSCLGPLTSPPHLL